MQERSDSSLYLMSHMCQVDAEATYQAHTKSCSLSRLLYYFLLKSAGIYFKGQTIYVRVMQTAFKPQTKPLSISLLHCPLAPQERWELSPEEAAAQSDSTYPKACPIGNLDNLAGSHIPFSTGPRACLGQVSAGHMLPLPCLPRQWVCH